MKTFSSTPPCFFDSKEFASGGSSSNAQPSAQPETRVYTKLPRLESVIARCSLDNNLWNWPRAQGCWLYMTVVSKVVIRCAKLEGAAPY